jgi:hypothetical protein
MFSFSFLLILGEGGLREGWVKSAYSSQAATAGRQRIITNSGTRQRLLSQGVPGHPCRLGADSKWFPVEGAAEFF